MICINKVRLYNRKNQEVEYGAEMVYRPPETKISVVLDDKKDKII